MAPARRRAGDWAILLTLSLGIFMTLLDRDYTLMAAASVVISIGLVAGPASHWYDLVPGYDLLDLAEAAGFAQLHLELPVDVRTGRRQSLAALTVVKG